MRRRGSLIRRRMKPQGWLLLLGALLAAFTPLPAWAQVTFAQITNSIGGYSSGSEPSVSADGTRIAFVSDRNLTGGNPDGNWEIFLWTQGSGFTQITNTTWDSRGGHNSDPAISSDGTRIAFLSHLNLTGGNSDGNEEIFLWTSGSGLTQITNTIGRDIWYGYSISADGTRIAFVSDHDLTGGNPYRAEQIFLWVQGNGITQITNDTIAWHLYPAISADGTRIVFVSHGNLTGGNPDGNEELFLWTQGSGITQLTNTTQYTTLVSTDSLSINVDGTRIVFVSNLNLNGGNPDLNFEIFLWTQGSAIIQITSTTWHSNKAPSISADGSRIVFMSMSNLTGGNPYGNQHEIFLWTQGSGFTQVTTSRTGTVVEEPSISADGTRVAFRSTDNLTGGNPDGNAELFLAQISHTPPTDTVTIVSGPSGTPNSVASGGSVNLNVSATDSQNHQLSYSWSALCSGLSSNGSFSNPNTQNPVWTAPANTIGSATTCALTVMASDGFGHSDTKSFQETVNATTTGHPVVLIHGWGGHPGPETWGQMKELLEQPGRPVAYFDNWKGSPVSSGAAQDLNIPIEVLAGRLGTQVRQLLSQFAPGTKVDIVAHSMGGLVARAWIAGMATSGPAYSGEIDRLITVATPHYGTDRSKWCPRDPCGEQVAQMRYGSRFLWDLHEKWERATNKPDPSKMLTIVATSDGFVEEASATLPEPVQARYVYKDHTSLLHTGDCGTDGVACVDADHPTLKLVRAFLLNGQDPADCSSSECKTTPSKNTGNLFVRFVEKYDPSIPVTVSEFADEEVLTFNPDPEDLGGDPEYKKGGPAGTLLVTDLLGASYKPTVQGLKFFLDEPKYMDASLPTAVIKAGRTTVLPQQPLQRTVDIYTVILATVDNVYVAGKSLFDLYVQLCCTIPTVQSNGVQNSIIAAAAQSTLMDGYVWVEIPGGGRFFLMPDFTNFTDVVTPVVSSLPVGNFAGSILRMPIPDSLPTGTYAFFAVGVLPGTDPFNSANWVTNRAEHTVTLTQ